LSFFKFNARAIREAHGPLLAGYPPPLRRVFFWYDNLSDFQRVQYAVIAMLFLIACGGYLLGLGSTIVLARVEAEQAAALADAPLPTLEPTATEVPAPVLATLAPTFTPAPSATPLPPTPRASATPFNAPVIAEPPAAPRQLPAAPVNVAPVAPRATATVAKPRNLETSKPEAPAASLLTPTPGLVRTVRTTVPTAVRQLATAAPTSEIRRGSTPLPTLAVPETPQIARTSAPASGPTRAAAVTAQPTSPPAQPTAVKTPPTH
jgi:hypothetical protein